MLTSSTWVDLPKYVQRKKEQQAKAAISSSEVPTFQRQQKTSADRISFPARLSKRSVVCITPEIQKVCLCAHPENIICFPSPTTQPATNEASHRNPKVLVKSASGCSSGFVVILGKVWTEDVFGASVNISWEIVSS